MATSFAAGAFRPVARCGAATGICLDPRTQEQPIYASDAALRPDLGSEAITLAAPLRANACFGEGLALGVERADRIRTRGRCWPDTRHWREPHCLRQVLPLSFPALPNLRQT